MEGETQYVTLIYTACNAPTREYVLLLHESDSKGIRSQ